MALNLVHKRLDTGNWLFGKVDDATREARLMATSRTLSPERLAETAQAGWKEIFDKEKKE